MCHNAGHPNENEHPRVYIFCKMSTKVKENHQENDFFYLEDHQAFREMCYQQIYYYSFYDIAIYFDELQDAAKATSSLFFYSFHFSTDRPKKKTIKNEKAEKSCTPLSLIESHNGHNDVTVGHHVLTASHFQQMWPPTLQSFV